MSKYVFIYHGGSVPDTGVSPDDVMAAWGAWFGSLGAAIIDGGNPTGESKTVGAGGSVSDGGGANPTSGYSLIEAASLDAAVAMAKGCPILAAGGTVEVAAAIDM
jgi:hypothetical protein